MSIEHLGKYPPDNAHHIKIRLGDNVNSYYCTKLSDSLTDYSSSWYPHWINVCNCVPPFDLSYEDQDYCEFACHC